MLPLLTHGAIWSAVGAIGGLALGLGIGGQGRWKATLAGGLVGGGAATVIYEIVRALTFASSKTELPLSSSVTTRVMAQLLVAILSAMCAGPDPDHPHDGRPPRPSPPEVSNHAGEEPPPDVAPMIRTYVVPLDNIWSGSAFPETYVRPGFLVCQGAVGHMSGR